MNRDVSSASIVNDTWESSSAINIAPRSRLEYLPCETAASTSFSAGQATKKAPLGRFLTAFGAKLKTDDHTLGTPEKKNIFSLGHKSPAHPVGTNLAKDTSVFKIQDLFKKQLSFTREDQTRIQKSARIGRDTPAQKDKGENDSDCQFGQASARHSQLNQNSSNAFAFQSTRTMGYVHHIQKGTNRDMSTETKHQDGPRRQTRNSVANGNAFHPPKSVAIPRYSPIHSCPELTSITRTDELSRRAGTHQLQQSGSHDQLASTTLALQKKHCSKATPLTEDSEAQTKMSVRIARSTAAPKVVDGNNGKQSRRKSFRSLVQDDEEFSDLLGLLRKTDANGCHGPMATRSNQPIRTTSRDLLLHPKHSKRSANHSCMEGDGNRPMPTAQQVDRVQMRRHSDPIKPLKSILLIPRYSHQDLGSTAVNDDIDEKTGMAQLQRSGSSVQFTSPTVHLIDRDRQNSGWYTQEDEARMKKKYIRSQMKKMIKKRERSERSS